MPSLLIPSTISLSATPNFVKRTGPRGTRIRKIEGFNLRIIAAPEGTRLFIDPISTVSSPNPVSALNTLFFRQSSAILAKFAHARDGLLYGYRRRLRLVGVGFRATVISNTPTPTQATVPTKEQQLLLKLGYSHDVFISPSRRADKGIQITPSKLEGRTKGTLLRLEGTDQAILHHWAATLRNLRQPDPYKGKGIHLDGEKLKLKKGKREA